MEYRLILIDRHLNHGGRKPLNHCYYCKDGKYEKTVVTFSDKGPEYSNDVMLVVLRDRKGICFRGYICEYHRLEYHEDGYAVYLI